MSEIQPNAGEGKPADSPQKELTSADLEKQIELLQKEQQEKPESPAPDVPPVVQEKEKLPEEKKNELTEGLPVKPEPMQKSNVEAFAAKPPDQPKPQEPASNQPLQNPLEEFKTWARENMAIDPVSTVIAINKIINRPIEEANRKNLLATEIMNLSASPETQDFNDPGIRAEMEKIVAESPQRYVDDLGYVKPEYMKALFYEARGRRYSVQKPVSPPQQVISPAPVEGKSRVAASPSIDVGKMSSSELEEYIKKLT